MCQEWNRADDITSAFRFVNSCLDTPLAKAIGAFLLAYVVYLFGRSAYFSQREAEQGRERYLDNGIDLVAANVDYALGIFRHNWTLFYRYLKLYRESDTQITYDDFFKQFQELDQARIQLAPAHRLQSLIANNVIWVAYQRVLAFVVTKNDKMKAEFFLTLENAKAAGVDVNREGVVKAGERMADDMSVEAEKFYRLLAELMDLAAIIEQTRLNRCSLAKIHKREDVRRIVAALRKIFSEKPSEAAPLMTPPTSGGAA